MLNPTKKFTKHWIFWIPEFYKGKKVWKMQRFQSDLTVLFFSRSLKWNHVTSCHPISAPSLHMPSISFCITAIGAKPSRPKRLALILFCKGATTAGW